MHTTLELETAQAALRGALETIRARAAYALAAAELTAFTNRLGAALSARRPDDEAARFSPTEAALTEACGKLGVTPEAFEQANGLSIAEYAERLGSRR